MNCGNGWKQEREAVQIEQPLADSVRLYKLRPSRQQEACKFFATQPAPPLLRFPA